MKQGFIIPIYRHITTVGPLTQKLANLGLPIILVDDGNGADANATLAAIAANIPGVVLVTLEKNRGKGGAFAHGLEKAAEMGLSHVLQIDADGQHDADRVPFFLAESAKNPDNIICGYPVYDETAPRSRVNGRKISNFWAAVVTLSGAMKDVLCGFRVYPVRESLRIMRNPFVDKRMGFDAEILVRLYWRKVFPIFYPIQVRYPLDGISNFRVVRDNVRISWTFCRLCAGMILRLPLLIKRKL
jgi:glycosyltransferase involved in cell wall biosynthesis